MFVDGEHEYEPDGVAVQFHLLSEEVAGWLALHSPEDRGAAGRELRRRRRGAWSFGRAMWPKRLPLIGRRRLLAELSCRLSAQVPSRYCCFACT